MTMEYLTGVAISTDDTRLISSTPCSSVPVSATNSLSALTTKLAHFHTTQGTRPSWLKHTTCSRLFAVKGISTHTRTHARTHTHTHPFNDPLSGTTQVSQYQKGKTNLDFTRARDSEWQWHQLGHMQVCTSLQTDNHASTSLLKLFLQAVCPSCHPTNSMKALKATTWGNRNPKT